MKLKSSNKKHIILLVVLSMLTILLLSLTLKVKGKKTSKYPATPEFEQKTPLDLIQITLSEKQYKKLKKKRNKALSIGILETSKDDYVPATIAFNGKEYKADIRLKGDWVDHLRGNKWSFRVKLKGDKTILGMKKFSIHHPTTRGYVNEWLYHKAIKDQNLFGLRYSFLEGSIHVKKKNRSTYISKSLGIYAIEESFDKRTIENNRRKESIILKISEANYWNEVKKATLLGADYGLKAGSFMDWQQKSLDNSQITTFSEEKVLSDTTNHKHFKLSKNLLEDLITSKKPLDKIFDIKELAMQNAILNLFGAIHGTYSINLRFYYNPITSKLEPTAFDGNSGLKLKKYKHFIFVNQEKDTAYLKELAYAISKIAQPNYLDELMNKHKKGLEYYQKILKTEFNRKFFDEKNLRYNQGIMNNELNRLIKKLKIDNIEKADDTLNNKSDVVKNNLGKSINIPTVTIDKWKKIKATIKNTNKKYNTKPIYKISRNTISENSYIIIDNIKTTPGSTIQISIIAKKSGIENYLGLRIQGHYPNRVDAVFDLEKGKVKGKSNGGDFTHENAKIESLGKSWYRCTLSGKVNSDKFKVLLGPTSDKRRVLSWEGKTEEKHNIYIIPSTLKIKHIK